MPVRVTALDHLVLRVADASASVAWYRDHLGLEPLRLDEWERGEVFFPSARVDEHTILDFLQVGAAAPGADEMAGRNVDHLCFVVDADDLAAIVASGEFPGASDPDTRWGARGDGTSVYVKDLDGTTVELRTYP